MTAGPGAGPKQSGRLVPLDHWYGNLARDHATVGVQAGSIGGSVHLHQEIHHGASPEQKYLEGKKALERGMPRRAEELIGQAVDGGHLSTEVAYRWVLSIVSGRSLDELHNDQFESLRHALKYVRNEPEDGWSRAVFVVGRLLDHLLRHDRKDSVEGPEWSKARAEYGELDQQRKEELQRHLDNILVGALRDTFAAREREDAGSQRFDGDRKERVWKFFAAEPAPPTPLQPPAEPRRTGTWLLLGCGSALALGALVLAGPVLAEQAGSSVAALTLLLGGGLVAVRAKARILIKRDLVRATTMRFEPPMEGNGGRWKPQHSFDRRVSFMVRGVFAEHDPEDEDAKHIWKAATAGMRLRLTKELSDSFRESETYATSVKYLAKWHAGQIAQHWSETGRLWDLPAGARPSSRAYLGLAAGLLAVVAGTALTWIQLWRHGGIVEYALLPVMAFIGIDLACEQWWTLVRARHRAENDLRYRDRRYREECDAYRKWCAVLADRPTDQEMARWLDLDRRLLRAHAMELYGLANREVVSHLVLCEDAPKAKRAQDEGGPMRYSAYLISVLLMTDWGVRLARFHLDFASGEYTERVRTVFRYDQVAVAQVAQVWVKTTGTHRQITPVEQEEAEKPDEWPGWRRNAFRLSLVNALPVTVLLEPSQEEFDDGEPDSSETDGEKYAEKRPEEGRGDWAELEELALDSSGVAGALHVMEAITADGRQWLDAEAKRRKRRLNDLGIASFVDG